jgi:hypothetical protein
MSQILYGVGLTPTDPWVPDPVKPFDMDPWHKRIAEVSDVRETAIAVLSWYAACVSLQNEEERKRLNKPCAKMSSAIASLEWVRENMPKIPCITDRDLTLMWLDDRVETVL